MAEALIWVGVALLTMALGTAAFDGLIYALLTPTRKSPYRPGDQEAREFAARSARSGLVLFGLGAALLTTGITLTAV